MYIKHEIINSKMLKIKTKLYCFDKAYHTASINITSTLHKMTSILYRSARKHHSFITDHHNFHSVQHF